MKLIDVTVSRSIPAPADRVFDVWFDPACPGSPFYGAHKAIVNATVDGLFYWGHENKGQVIAHYGRFTKLARGKLAEHTWMSVGTHGLDTTVSISFEAMAGGTQVTIKHSGLPDDEGGRGHEGGWSYFLGLLEKGVAK